MDTQIAINNFEFKCSHCSRIYSFESFQSNLLYFGLILLVDYSEGYLGTLCRSCRKVSLSRYLLDEINIFWNELNDSLQTINNKLYNNPKDYIVLDSTKLTYNSFSNYSDTPPNLFYRKDIVISLGKSEEIIKLTQKEIYDEMGIIEDKYYLSYLKNTKIFRENVAIYGIRKEDINKIIELENKTGIKIIPRYYYDNKLMRCCDKYCLEEYDNIFKGSFLNVMKSKFDVGKDKDKDIIISNIDFLLLLEQVKTQLNYISVWDIDDSGNKIDLYEEFNKSLCDGEFPRLCNVIGPSEILCRNDKFVRHYFGTLMSEYHPENPEFNAKNYVVPIQDAVELMKNTRRSSDNSSPVEMKFRRVIEKSWSNFEKEYVQSALRKNSYEYCLNYIKESSKISFSIPYSVEIILFFVDRIDKLIESNDNNSLWEEDSDSNDVIQKVKMYEENYPSLKNIITKDRRINEIKIDIVEKYAKYPCNILILGANGTGKELIARALYEVSPNFKESFIVVNCAAITDTIFESQFFGHEKGMFSGAVKDHKGFIEAANNGTLFLDEIGNLSLDNQRKLLRFVQEKKFLKVGGTTEQEVNLRLICATNADLRKGVKEKIFQEDFFHRINTLSIKLPPLQDRDYDIEILFNYFWDIINKNYNSDKKINLRGMQTLKSYSWPGNIRELSNFVTEVFVHSKENSLIEDFIYKLPKENFLIKENSKLIDNKVKSKKIFSDDELIDALKRNNNNITHAAKELGIARETLQRRIRKIKEKGNFILSSQEKNT